MARTAAVRIHLVETNVSTGYDGAVTFRDYNVEVRQGRTVRTIGRVSGTVRNGRGQWMGLPIGASAWTCRHTTRRAALDALIARENWQTVRAAAEAARYALVA